MEKNLITMFQWFKSELLPALYFGFSLLQQENK